MSLNGAILKKSPSKEIETDSVVESLSLQYAAADWVSDGFVHTILALNLAAGTLTGKSVASIMVIVI